MQVFRNKKAGLFRQRVNRLAGAFVAFAAFVLAFGLLSVRAQPPSAPPTSLQNGGFEGSYAPYQGDQTRLLAPGWTPWNLTPSPSDPSYVNQTPVYRTSANPARIHSGSAAQEYFTFYATHTAGVYQQVSVTPGSTVQFSAYLNVWSSDGDNVNRSDNPGGVSVQVGIDPDGGTDATAAGIIWSSAQEFYDQYRQLTASTTAEGGVVTVFVRSAVKQPVKNNHVYVDDAALAIQAPVPPSATNVPPSDTPVPPTETAVPSDTVQPSDTSIPATDTVQPSDTPFPTDTPIPTDTDTPAGSPSPTREGTVPPPGQATATPSDTEVSPIATTPGGETNPTTVPTPIPSGAGFLYTVQSGDTLSALALRFGTTVDAIVSANGLTSGDFITVGQQLLIPVQLTPTPEPTLEPTLIPTLIPSLVPLTPVPTLIPLPPAPATPVGAYPYPPGLNGPTVNGIGTYIVQPGDTLASIAALYRITPQALARLNGIVNPQGVYPGQILAVPGPGNNASGRPPVSVNPPRAFYTVQPGDDLFRISLRFNVTLAALMSANGIVNPNLIFVGEQLIIP